MIMIITIINNIELMLLFVKQKLSLLPRLCSPVILLSLEQKIFQRTAHEIIGNEKLLEASSLF